MINSGATDGEKLCALLRYKFVGQARWSSLADEIRFTLRENDWSQCFQQILAVSATGRIVAGGGSLAEEFELEDPQFDSGFRQFVQDTFLIPKGLVNELLRHGKRAVKASRGHLSGSLADSLLDWAESKHPTCYICGQLLNFTLGQPNYRDYTADHIWPRNYGGNSEKENILPACRGCNNEKKKGFATWAMTDFQSVSLGLKPSEDSFTRRVHGEHRFALHYKAAQAIADEGRITLKQAFSVIGPWAELRLIDKTDVGDFFNLRIHKEA